MIAVVVGDERGPGQSLREDKAEALEREAQDALRREREARERQVKERRAAARRERIKEGAARRSSRLALQEAEEQRAEEE